MTQLHHALIDWNCFAKPKMKAMRVIYGHLSRLWFVDCILDMSQATSGSIAPEVAIEMAKEIGIEQPQALLSYCIEQGIFIEARDGTISNERVLQDKVKLQKRRDEQNKRKRKERDKPVTRGVTPVTDTVTDTESKKETVTTPAIPSEPLTMPAALDSPESRKALALFCAKYREKFKSSFDQILLDAAMMPYGNRINDWIRDVSGSVGWKKIRDCSKPEPEKRWPDKQAQPERKSVVPNAAETGQRMREIVAQASKKPIDPKTKAKIEKLTGSKTDEDKYGKNKLQARGCDPLPVD